MQALLEKEARYKAALAKAMKLTKAKLYDEQDDEQLLKPAAARKVSTRRAGKESVYNRSFVQAAPVQREALSVAEKLAQRAKLKKVSFEFDLCKKKSVFILFERRRRRPRLKKGWCSAPRPSF